MADLPTNPSLEWLRKEAKRRHRELRQSNPGSRLADAQFDIAKQYGFTSWRALKSHTDSLTLNGQLKDAARNGDAERLASLLDAHQIDLRTKPYDTLLHEGASSLPVIDLLLRRGADVNAREDGDNTHAMHWAAARGHLDIVRRLADAGGDILGDGADHFLTVLGWATCFDLQRPVAEFLISRGARHHIFSAIAMSDADAVRRIVAADAITLHQRLGRSENERMPLHFAVMRNRPDMVALLLELGADPQAGDGGGFRASFYSTEAVIDRVLLEKTRAGDVIAALALGEWEVADRLMHDGSGALHVMAKRGDERAVRWLLARGADPNELWGHWDARVTPLHLAAAQGHAAVVRLLLDAGADPNIRDSKHDGDAVGWAEYGASPQSPNWREIVEIIRTHTQ